VEGLSTPLGATAESMSLRKKKKGKIGISGVLWLLGQIQPKLDRVRAGFDLKPNRKRKRVRILGLTNVVGWASGPVLEVGSDHNSGQGHHLELGHYSIPGHPLDPGQIDFVSSFLLLELVLDVASHFMHSLGFPLISEGGLELDVRASMDSSLGPSLVEFPLLLVQVLGENGSIQRDGSASDGSANDALLSISSPSPASSFALASSGTFEALVAPAMVSVGSTESEDRHLDLDPDLDPEQCVVGVSPLVFCTFDTIIDTTSVELTDTQLWLIKCLRE
jgi:hypothetical protein